LVLYLTSSPLLDAHLANSKVLLVPPLAQTAQLGSTPLAKAPPPVLPAQVELSALPARPPAVNAPLAISVLQAPTRAPSVPPAPTVLLVPNPALLALLAP